MDRASWPTEETDLADRPLPPGPLEPVRMAGVHGPRRAPPGRLLPPGAPALSAHALVARHEPDLAIELRYHRARGRADRQPRRALDLRAGPHPEPLTPRSRTHAESSRPLWWHRRTRRRRLAPAAHARVRARVLPGV